MKKIIVSLIILLLLSATLSFDSFAKPAYCGQALQRCADQCRSVMGGDWNPLTGGCVLGCSIGYLYCG